MHLLEYGVLLDIIALLMHYESNNTTHRYADSEHPIRSCGSFSSSKQAFDYRRSMGQPWPLSDLGSHCSPNFPPAAAFRKGRKVQTDPTRISP